MDVVARKGKYWKVENGKKTEISLDEYNKAIIDNYNVPDKMKDVFKRDKEVEDLFYEDNIEPEIPEEPNTDFLEKGGW